MSQNYQSYSLGIGKNLGSFGAVSVDVTQAKSTFNDGRKQQGQSYRFRYNKNLNNIGTNIALAGYRYSTSGFYSLSEVFDLSLIHISEPTRQLASSRMPASA